MVRKGGILKSLRLFHVNEFGEVAVEKCIRDVQLANMPIFADCER